MRKLFFTSMMILLSCHVLSQLTLDASYSGILNSGKHFIYIDIDSNEYKYAVIDPYNSNFTLYNLNHSVYLNVAIPIAYTFGSNEYTISYISKRLVDCDSSNIEYIMSFLGNGGPTNYPKKTLIYRTDGTLLQAIDSCVFMNYSDGWKYGPVYNPPVISTPLGTKLLLRHLNGDAKVYNLCGEFYAGINENSASTNQKSAFPNPTNDYITIPYNLPENVSSGKISLYNNSGILIKSFSVDKTFNDIIISTTQLPSGAYYYVLQAGNYVSEGKQFIKVGN